MEPFKVLDPLWDWEDAPHPILCCDCAGRSHNLVLSVLGPKPGMQIYRCAECYDQAMRWHGAPRIGAHPAFGGGEPPWEPW